MSDEKSSTPQKKDKGEQIKDREKENINVAKEKEEVDNEKQEKSDQNKFDNIQVDEKKEEKIDFIKAIKPGMTIRIYQKIKELNTKDEEKERIQYFEGLVIAKKHGSEPGASVTLRKISNGIGVEKIFPLHLPSITKIEIKKQAKVKRAKLGFLRKGYKKKLKEKRVDRIIKDTEKKGKK